MAPLHNGRPLPSCWAPAFYKTKNLLAYNAKVFTQSGIVGKTERTGGNSFSNRPLHPSYTQFGNLATNCDACRFPIGTFLYAYG